MAQPIDLFNIYMSIVQHETFEPNIIKENDVIAFILFVIYFYFSKIRKKKKIAHNSLFRFHL